MVLEYRKYRWRSEFGTQPFENAGEDAPRSLARSPIVWLSWRSRVEAITAALKAGRFNPRTRGGGLFHHTDPTRSSAGFAAIYLMAYSYPNRPVTLDITVDAFKSADTADLGYDQVAFQTWFRRCQRIRREFPASLDTLTRRLSHFGPDNYDMVVTHENLALESMLSFNNRWSEYLYLFYPPATVTADTQW
jgi:hypothetical protein